MSEFQFSDGQSEITGDFSKLEALIADLKIDRHVDIGVFATAVYDDGTPVATVGAAHEFGVLIKHPGGTSYTIGPNGQARFVKAGTKGIVGTTKAHDIQMPKLSFIRVPLQNGQSKITKYVMKHAKEHLEAGDVAAIFEDIGIAGEAVIREAFDEKGPGWQANTPATKKRKGSDTPLKDEGRLEDVITHRVGE